jgi:hypothetical protein
MFMASLPLPTSTQQFHPLSAPKWAASLVGVEAPPRLSALEWSIVAMAEQDGLASLREPGRFLSALNSLFGVRPPNRLANERLEALRRIAVMAWHHRWNVPKSELNAFLKAGFTLDEYELIQTSIGQSRIARTRKRAR